MFWARFMELYRISGASTETFHLFFNFFCNHSYKLTRGFNNYFEIVEE